MKKLAEKEWKNTKRMIAVPDETFHSLEFPKIIEFVNSLSLTPYSKKYINNIKFSSEKEVVTRALQEVQQMKEAILFDDALPFMSIEDLRPFLEKLVPEESFLEVNEIVFLKHQLSLLQEVEIYFSKRKEKYKYLYFYSAGIADFSSLIQMISDKIDANGEIYDNASPELKKVRRELFEKEKQSKSMFNRLLKKYKEYTQDDIITLRDGRAVLAIQDIHYHKVPGIVHGTSGSEQTYYVEPLEALKISNEIQNLRIQERKIIVKILRQISTSIRDFRSEITYSLENLGNLDFIYAKAKFANKINGIAPVINEREYYSIQNAKHPLLVLKMGFENVIPLNLYLGDEARMLIVTGPNAGGKTVVLKTIGLIQLLTQCGFLSPVEEGSELPLVKNIFVDIGDNQSIEKDLSTFSSHVVNIKNIVAAADEESLILMDELGASTDPEEGAALGMALIEWMINHKMYGIVTTHLGKIKVFASEKDGVENGSMEFDMDNISPTYRLQIGIPGASYAFHIAKRYGMSEEIIDLAKGYLGEKKHSIESLIISLNENIQQYSEKMKQVSIKQSEVEGLKGLYETRASALKVERQKIRQQASEEMNEYLRKVRLDMENTIKELKEMKKTEIDKNKISEARKKLQEEQKSIDKEREELNKEEGLSEVEVGQTVKLKELGRRGTVITEANEKGRLWLDVDGLKMQVRLNQLSLLTKNDKKNEKEETRRKREDFTTYDTKTSFELDLRGMDALEAIEVTNEYLNNALNANWSEVRIIHGKGKGVLRVEINKFLGKDKRVLEKRMGKYGEGDSGVTVVKLKTEQTNI